METVANATGEATFRNVFLVLFGAMVVTRLYFHRMARTWERHETKPEEILFSVARLVLGIPLLLSLFVYAIRPQWMAWATAPLPAGLRWTGAALTAVSIGLLWWVNWALGKNFSTALRIRENHILVTHGPYRWVRHPMYTVVLLMLIGFSLLTANWLWAACGVVLVLLLMTVRTPREEKMLLEAFGEEYRAYMQRTGRFWPKIP